LHDDDTEGEGGDDTVSLKEVMLEWLRPGRIFGDDGATTLDDSIGECGMGGWIGPLKTMSDDREC
jgi:hypothetical protein